MNPTSAQIIKVLEIIENKELSKKELINYFNNINNHKDLNENDKEKLIYAVEKKLDPFKMLT